MSPTVDNFVHDLVAMAQAFDEAPRLKSQLAQLERELNLRSDAIMHLELQAIDRKTEIDTLHDRIRSLEVERDDASFRSLVAEDKADATLRALRDMQVALGSLVSAMEPPKPEPTPEPIIEPLVTKEDWFKEVASSESDDHLKVLLEEPLGQSAESPTSSAHSEGPHVDTLPVSEMASVSLPEGVSVQPDPTASKPGTEPQSASSPIADNIENAASNALPKPYFGKKYMDIPGYVSLWDWLEGGGTEAGYHWRYGSPEPEVA